MDKPSHIPENILEPPEAIQEQSKTDGKESEVSPQEFKEFEENEAMKKLEYIYEPGTAYHGLSYLNFIKNKALSADDFPEGIKNIHGENESANRFPVMRRSKRTAEGKVVIENGYASPEYIPIFPDNVRSFLEQQKFKLFIKNVFRYGVQQLTHSSRADFAYGEELPPVATNAEEYRKRADETAKSNDQMRIHFNIVGRGLHGFSAIKGGTRYNNGGVTLIFKPPEKEVRIDEKNLNFGEYRATGGTPIDSVWKELIQHHPDIRPNDPGIRRELKEIFDERRSKSKSGVWTENTDEYLFNEVFTKDGKTKVEEDNGFVLRNRIAPVKFRGLVLDFSKFGDTFFEEDVIGGEKKVPPDNDKELYDKFMEFYQGCKGGKEDLVRGHSDNVLRVVVQTMLDACVDHPENTVPIYDVDGNLLWPKKMTRDEIVKETNATIDERDPNYADIGE